MGGILLGILGMLIQLGVMVGIGGLGWSLWNNHRTVATPTGDQTP